MYDRNLDSDDSDDAETIRINTNYMYKQQELKDKLDMLDNDLEELQIKIEDLQKPECKLTTSAKMLMLKDQEDAIAKIKIDFEVINIQILEIDGVIVWNFWNLLKFLELLEYLDFFGFF